MARTTTNTKNKTKTQTKPKTNKPKVEKIEKVEKEVIFSRKEAKEKVLKTKVGQKTSKLLFIFAILFLIAFAGSMFSDYIIDKLNLDISTLAKDLIKITLDYLFFITGITMCYFDGKMDGLIASHKK